MSRIRITGGKCRSRLISVADVPGLRPTPDRVRVTLFNWLGQTLDGLVCLDLFAGSGILGFEAASRGAQAVSLVDCDRTACEALRQNAENLCLNEVEIQCSDAVKFAVSSRRRYDVIFLDPPYRQGWIERVAPLLTDLAAPGARVYVEAEYKVGNLDSEQAWRLHRHGQAGQVFYHLFERSEEVCASEEA